MKTYRDHYFKQAKQDGYPARSVYKLREMDARFQLLRPGLRVLDLGAAPGSWSLYAAERVGPSGRVLAMDLQEVNTAFPPQVLFLQGDVFEPSAFQAEMQAHGPFHLTLSDMAPATTGIRFADQARSVALAEQALALARQGLLKGGGFVVKVFMGPEVKPFMDSMRPLFDKVRNFKPKSSRSESMETFCLGLGFKGTPEKEETGD